jgi:hypothetical protein
MIRREEADLIEQLLDAADSITTKSSAELADISALREVANDRKQSLGGDKAA